MALIKTILIRSSNGQLTVIPVPGWYLQFTLAVDAETALEGIRQYFVERWNAKVHALQWVFPEDVVPLEYQDKIPFLVLWVDELGSVPVTQDRVPFKEITPFLVAAANPCACEPWSLPNWFHELSGWVKSHFCGAEQISQIRTCPNGAVVRIACKDKAYFLKTQSAALSYESTLLRILNQRTPGICPPILSITPDSNSHVTEAIEGSHIDLEDCSNDWAIALADVARFQIRSADFVSELSQAGVPCRNLALLEANLDELLDDAVAIQTGAPNELQPGELENLSRLNSRVSRDFETLNRCELPASLIHGDLNWTNALKTKLGRTVLIDWALSRITHPFFTLGSTLFDPSRRNHSMCEALSVAYLGPWSDFGVRDRLRAGLDAASRLFWLDSAFAIRSLCEPGHIRNIINLPRFLRVALNAYQLSAQH